VARTIVAERDALAADNARLRAELAEARRMAACAHQSWKMNDFDVRGNQQALLNFALKEDTQ
jgi:hypothetical protein